jgi:hypothetical protein
MERRFWMITLVFFIAVIVCFLLVATQHIAGMTTSAVASTESQYQRDLMQDQVDDDWDSEHLMSTAKTGGHNP